VHYQLHILQVVRRLLSPECTIVAVLHDLNMAFEYGDHFVLLERGTVAVNTDDPRAIPAEVLERVFRVRARHLRVPDGGGLWRFEL
jgi:iron complex transport system ATP-binding protein